MLHAEDSKFYGWASSRPEIEPEENQPVRVCVEFVDTLKSLPYFQPFEAQDLISMARKKMGYREESGRQINGGIRISDRVTAIAILLGGSSVTNPKFQIPAKINPGVGMPKFVQ